MVEIDLNACDPWSIQFASSVKCTVRNIHVFTFTLN